MTDSINVAVNGFKLGISKIAQHNAPEPLQFSWFKEISNYNFWKILFIL